MRSMVWAAGGAPAVRSLTFRPAAGARAASGALAMPMRTVGAAQSVVTPSSPTSLKIATGSTLRRQTCAHPRAVASHVKVQPLAWNIGSVHR